MIVRLFDQAGAPERVGRQFIDNLAGAVVVEHMRGRPRPWGAADTVDMFVELYARILGDRPGRARPDATRGHGLCGGRPLAAAPDGGRLGACSGAGGR